MAMWGSMRGYNPDQGFSFEGPEKRLEIIVRFLDETNKEGFLSFEDSSWEHVVGSLNAEIVSREKNGQINSYVLTESSLFVLRNKIVLITCGTTTLLNSVPIIMELISCMRGEVEWVSFMHKNYSFPWEQKGPHTSLSEEFNHLKTHFPTGKPYILGPVDSDHYFFFCYDDIIREEGNTVYEADAQLSMTMYGLDHNQTKHWFHDKFECTNDITQKIRKDTKLDILFNKEEGWTIHDLQFEPCGYSINAIRGSDYATTHITPESHCSFASFETNANEANYFKTVLKVLDVFRPQRFTVIVIIDPYSEVGKLYHANEPIGVEPSFFVKKTFDGSDELHTPFEVDYCVMHRAVNEFAPGYVAMKINYVQRSALEKLKEEKSEVNGTENA
ncbi:S-adenosylmethionine decarboxylase proenzyme [Angomonas deanei]|nr:S-adenosylmethionine decarboxylase [Angomonas deanei]EPY41146.1 S-adenosylmethionine decarboxylase proenzyme [Angomonas deanei]|eukprot:EPY31157.1 S-adenosylmethionine decarboxylase [Angomonas deanei]